MNESIEHIVSRPWYRKQLFFFIGGSILIAFLMVVISMALYTSSGASLLDASKPGFKKVQSEIKQTDNFEAFSSDGSVGKATLDQFQQLYSKQIKPVSSAGDYDTTALDAQALGIDDPSDAN